MKKNPKPKPDAELRSEAVARAIAQTRADDARKR